MTSASAQVSTTTSHEAGWREAILRRELRRNAECLSRLVEKLRYGEDYVTETPLYRLLGTTARFIAESIQNAPPDELQLVNYLLCQTAEYLRYAERSRVAHSPWSMVQTVEDFLRRQVGTRNDFIIRPQWAYNYGINIGFVEVYRTSLASFHWFPYQDWEKALGIHKDERIFCISFPRLERLNCLSHALWGHEIGHVIADTWVATDFLAFWQAQEPTIRAALQAEYANSPIPIDPLFKQAAIAQWVSAGVDEAMKVAQDGVTELICDAIGVHLFGPAALAASAEFCARFSLDESPLDAEHYPPWRYRLRLMLQSCDEDLQPHSIKRGKGDPLIYPGAFAGPFVTWLEDVRRLTLVTTDQTILTGRTITKEVYKAIDANWQSIKVSVLSSLPSKSRSPYRLHKRLPQIQDLVDRLKAALPPNESGNWPHASPASLEDIINAAWAYKLLMIAENPSWGAADEFERLFRLALKGIESSYVHKAFGHKLKERK